MTDLLELRAALTQLAKALETERACVLRIMHIVERQIADEQPEAVPISILHELEKVV